MFSALLRVGEELFGKTFIVIGRGAAFPRAGNRAEQRATVGFGAAQRFGGGAHESEAAHLHKEGVGRGINAAQRSVESKGFNRRFTGKFLGKNDLNEFAVTDQAFGFFYHGAEIVFGRIGLENGYCSRMLIREL